MLHLPDPMDDNSPCSDGTNTTQPTSATSPHPPATSQQPSAPKFSNGPHIRSRITVVCAECKRLKLKCDRRNPCGSCVKRDTVHRCQYSAAAAEKIDVQSLHNRLQIVESQIAQIVAGGLRGPVSVVASSDNLPFPHNDRAMLATGMSGSSVTISLDDVAALWLEHLDLPSTLPTDGASSSQPPEVKLEPTTVELPPNDEPPLTALLPPLSVYFPSSCQTAVVTPQLVALLPSAPTMRSRITCAIEETMRMHPCLNVKHFKSRIENMFAWAKEEDGRMSSGGASANAKADLARSIFFGMPSSSSSPPAATPPRTPPSLTFFASVAAAYALGVQTFKDNEAACEAESSRSGAAKAARLDDAPPAKTSSWQKCSPGGLYMLSVQALQTHEHAHAYDLDWLAAAALQVLFLLHDGKPRVAHVVYPLVGKMVSVAQMMGLNADPDEFPGKYSLFEAEMRRRVWWDVYYYDVFVADCMGQAPMIRDDSYTTKMPADVDEEQFGPMSTALPVPVPRGAGGDPSEVGFAYFIQKCRLAQLIKSVKKRSFKDPLLEDAAPEQLLEQAEQFEDEVKRWLADLPKAFRLDDSPTPSVISASLQAQRCELAIVANQVILKLFLPFLKAVAEPGSDLLPRRVVSSVIDAAHAIIAAIRRLHTVWKHTRPAAFAFYAFGRTLFDAAVMAANAVILHPAGAAADVALADVGAALEVMKATRIAMGHDRGAAPCASEAMRITEALRAKAEAVRSGDGLALHAGMKRKYADLDAERVGAGAGFVLPYVGAGVACAQPSAEPPRPSTSTGRPARRQRESSVTFMHEAGRPDDAPEDTKAQVPPRGRPRHNSSAARPRTATSAMPAPIRIPAHSHAGTPVPAQSPFHSMQELPMPDPPPPPPPAMEFAVPYGAPGPDERQFGGTPQPQAGDARRFSLDGMTQPAGGMYDASGYAPPELSPPAGGMSIFTPPAYPPPAQTPQTPFGQQEYFGGVPVAGGRGTPGVFEGEGAGGGGYMKGTPQQPQQRTMPTLAASISQAQSAWAGDALAPASHSGEMWSCYQKYY